MFLGQGSPSSKCFVGLKISLETQVNITIELFQLHSVTWGDSWIHVAATSTCLQANFRFPSTDTGTFQHLLSKVLYTCLPLPPLEQTWTLYVLVLALPLNANLSSTSLFVLLVASVYSPHNISAEACLVLCFSKTTIRTVWYSHWSESKFLFWGWPRRMWVLPLADDCGCLVWA